MTIEQRLLRKYGTTTVPELSTWILKDGTLVNGSLEGFQRDINHHEVNQFFKHSIRERPGETWIYVLKFLRRGNIRMMCSTSERCAQLATVPTRDQFRSLARVMDAAMHDMRRTQIEWYSKRGRRRSAQWPCYVEWLRRYTGIVPECYDCFEMF